MRKLRYLLHIYYMYFEYNVIIIIHWFYDPIRFSINIASHQNCNAASYMVSPIYEAILISKDPLCL